ncbi:MAG: helix-turn-helix domain-containing protein [Ferruginibacter sp.]
MMEYKRSDCPISHFLEVFGDTWSLIIIRDLMFYNKLTSGDFRHSEEKIATNVLVKRLNALVKEKILIKTVSPAKKSMFLYSLTERGADLLPILTEITNWSSKYNSISSLKPVGKKNKEDKRSVEKRVYKKNKAG